MNPTQLAEEANRLAERAGQLAQHAQSLATTAAAVAPEVEPFIFLLAIFLMACFVGYYVVWNVTPALHSPLMAVTNAISAIVIVGAMLAAALTETTLGKTMGMLAVALAAVNVFGGFLVTRRMLEMFRKKDKSSATGRGNGK